MHGKIKYPARFRTPVVKLPYTSVNSYFSKPFKIKILYKLAQLLIKFIRYTTTKKHERK